MLIPHLEVAHLKNYLRIKYLREVTIITFKTKPVEFGKTHPEVGHIWFSRIKHSTQFIAVHIWKFIQETWFLDALHNQFLDNNKPKLNRRFSSTVRSTDNVPNQIPNAAKTTGIITWKNTAIGSRSMLMPRIFNKALRDWFVCDLRIGTSMLLRSSQTSLELFARFSFPSDCGRLALWK